MNSEYNKSTYFDVVSVGGLVLPAATLPQDHIPSSQLDFIAHTAQRYRAMAAGEQVRLSAPVYTSPALVGYIMDQVNLGRTELEEEEITDIPEDAVDTLRGFVDKEGGTTHTFGLHELDMAIGAYVLSYDGTNYTHELGRTGLLTVSSMQTVDAAGLYILKSSLAQRGLAIQNPMNY